MRSIFKDRVRDKLYKHLISGPLKDWDVGSVMNLSDVIMKENINRIDEYLRSKEITLDNINQAVDEIVFKILIPSVKIK